MNIVTVKLILLVLKSYVVDIRPQAICKVRISNAANYAIASVKENIPPNNVENKTNQISDISGTSPLQIGNNLDQTLIPGSKDVKTSVKEPESSNGILPSDHPLSETKKNETIKSGHKKGGPPKSETKSEVKKNEVKSHEKAKNEIPRNEITSSELPKEKIRNEKVPIPEKVAGSKDDLEKQKKGSSAAKATDLTYDLTKTEGNGHSTLLGSRLLASENPISADYTLHSPDVDKASLPTEKVLKNEKMTPVVDKLKPEETANGTHTAVLRSEPASSKSLSKDEGLNLAKAPSLPKSPNAITDSSSSKVSGLTENSSSIKSSSSYESIATGYDASFACDMDFYKQWITLNIRCGQALLNVEAAVTASSCTLSNIQVPTAGGVFCVSLCSFPTCEKNIWNYTSSVGIASPIYKGYNLSSFMTSSMLSSMNVNPSNPPYNTNILVTSSSTCSTAFDGSYSRCTCSPQSEIVTTDDQKKIDRIIAMQHGIVPKDSTTTLGTVVTPLAHTVTSVTIGSAGLAAISSSSGATFVGGSSGINAVVSIDFCQFIAALNCLNISGSSTAQTHMAVQMSSFMFMFPFWKAKQSDSHRRLDASDRSSMSGVAVYSRYVGIDEDMLFLATLAGVGCILFGILGLFGLAYLIAGIFMSRTKFLTLFYDKMIGFEILILTLSQYTIGLTATYQIYRSFEMDELTDIKLYAAILSLVFLAIGIIFFGYYIVKQNEEQIKDVGTSTHLEKAVCMRYGALYDEYKFKDRYFFAPKMMLVLLAGCVTGFVGISSAVQVGILLSAHVLFFVYLEIRSPHHSRFVQTTTSFVTIMKIAALVLTFFLISAAGADGFPTELQHGVSLAIVGLNLVVLFMLTVRSLYAFYKKYKLQKQAKRNGETMETVDEYFKENTPQQPDKLSLKPCEPDSQDAKSSHLTPSTLQPDAHFISNQDRRHRTRHVSNSGTQQLPVAEEYTRGYFHAPRQHHQRNCAVEL